MLMLSLAFDQSNLVWNSEVNSRVSMEKAEVIFYQLKVICYIYVIFNMRKQYLQIQIQEKIPIFHSYVHKKKLISVELVFFNIHFVTHIQIIQ